MFNHTDLKIENVFYTKRNKRDHMNNTFEIVIEDDTISYGIYKEGDDTFLCSKNKGSDYLDVYEFILADFDKSSISYHGIRFHSDFGQNHPLISTVGINPDQVSDGAYIFWEGNNRSKTHFYPIYNYHKFEMSPYEIFAQRYSPFPYYLGWDFQSLIISVLAHVTEFSQKFSLFPDPNTYKFTNNFKDLCAKYLGEDGAIDVDQVYKGWNWDGNFNPEKYGGSFDKMLAPLRSNLTPLSIYKINNVQNVSSNLHNNLKLFLTPRERKLILSLPFYPDVKSRENNWFVSNDTRAVVNIEKTKKLLHGYKEYNNIEYFIKRKHTSELILYTGKLLNENYIIVLTNRYSTTQPLGSVLCEWDYIHQDDFFAEVVAQFAVMPFDNPIPAANRGNSGEDMRFSVIL